MLGCSNFLRLSYSLRHFYHFISINRENAYGVHDLGVQVQHDLAGKFLIAFAVSDPHYVPVLALDKVK